MIQQIDDLRAEAGELAGLLACLREDDWPRATLFKAWTVDDIVRHLHMGDTMALASATDPEAFAALMADIQARRKEGLSRIEETRQRLDGLGGRRLLERWRETLERLCVALATKAPDARLKWSGPDMGVRMFTTARQMETWSHAQAIYDLLGVERPPPARRLRNIAEIGVRTFGWAYRNRGLPVPAVVPSVQLVTWATPLALTNTRPGHFSEEEYYRAPVDNYRTYPVYHPDREPAGYWEALKRKKPEPLVDLHKKDPTFSWIAAGKRVWDEIDVPFFRLYDAESVSMARSRDYVRKNERHLILRPDGTLAMYRWVITPQGIGLSLTACSSCHTRYLDNGNAIAGAGFAHHAIGCKRGSAQLRDRLQPWRALAVVQLSPQARVQLRRGR